MRKVRIAWTDLALTDLECILQYVSCDSHKGALDIGDAIFAQVDTLVEFPNKGRIIPQLGKTSYRELFVHSYRIMYKVEMTTVFIVGIIHMATDFSPSKLYNAR